MSMSVGGRCDNFCDNSGLEKPMSQLGLVARQPTHRRLSYPAIMSADLRFILGQCFAAVRSQDVTL